MKKFFTYLCPGFFCALLLGMCAALLLGPDKAYAEKEKRYLAEAPVFSFESISDHSAQQQLEDWTADQFPARDFFVGLNAYWKLFTGRNAQQDVYYAKSDFLIKSPVSQDLSIYEKTLQRFDAFAAKTSVPVSLILIPSAGSMKSELLPPEAALYPDHQMFELAQASMPHVMFYDFRPALQTADLEEDVFYHTDHHLTSFGNYSLYCAWRQARNESFRVPSDFSIETSDGFYGTSWSSSGYWLTSPDKLQLWDPGISVSVTIQDGGEEPIYADSLFFREHLQDLDQYPVFLDGNHCEVTITNEEGTDGNLLIIRDSYGHCFAPFLATHYHSISLLDLRYFRGSITEYVSEHEIDEILFLYGTNTLLTDTNSAWLF